MSINVLLSSAAYLLTDHFISSEGTTCLQLIRKLESRGIYFNAIGGYVHVRKIPKNARLFSACSVKAFPYDNILKKYLAHFEFITKSYLKASKLLKTEKIDIIHHMFPAVYNQTFSLMAINRNFYQPFIFGPISVHFTSRPVDERIFSKITLKLHHRTISKCSHLIAITNYVKKLYSKLFDKDKISVIPLGVDAQTFRPSNKNKMKEEFEVLFVGSLYPLKGVEYLIRSIKYVAREEKKIKLRIVGEGPEKRRLKLLVNKLKLKNNVHFEGFVPYDRIMRYYQNCDVFCFPTLGEPFGKAILEAMACGKPVIASNIGGPAEIVENEKTGYLVNPMDVKSMAERILRLIKDRKLREKMGRNARRRVLDKFSLDKISEEYYRLYCRLV